MSRFVLAAALVLSTSGAVFANDFSGNLAFPPAGTSAAQTQASGVDRTVTRSIVRQDRTDKAVKADAARTAAQPAPFWFFLGGN